MDGFHLSNAVLAELGRRDRKGAPDTFDVDGYLSLLQRLREADEAVTYAPRFDRSLEESIGSAVPVPRDTPLVITEGNYLLHDKGGWQHVRGLLDEVWFLDVPNEVRRGRLVARRLSNGHPADEAEAWVAQVDEPNALLAARSRSRADLIVQLLDASCRPSLTANPNDAKGVTL